MNIDGKQVAADVLAECVSEIETLKAAGVTPGLAVVLVGEDPASQVYVNSKVKKCGELGLHSKKIAMSAETTQAELLAVVRELNADDLDAMSWEAVASDALGRINIGEHRSLQPGQSGAHVFARVHIHSELEQTKQLNFGFSDRGLVFLNGRLIFSGINTYRSRSLRYLGAMTVDNDAITLSLDEGHNELAVVVSESFGGWGRVARLEDTEQATVSPGSP